MKKLWQKHNSIKTDGLINEYCFNEGAILDNKLILWDVLGSIAHAEMLFKIDIITQEELIKLKKILQEILKLSGQGKFFVEKDDEDIHTKVENYLTEKLGDLGKKIHTARSRNDQVLVDLRLFAKDQLMKLASSGFKLIERLIFFAKQYEFIPMPGYTHMQKAMPSSVGLWIGSFAESLIDDFRFLKATYELNNQSPLGSGAAYGVSLPIDRTMTGKLLSFKKVQNNSLYCQASRPKIQLAIIQGLVQIMLTLSKFAEDLLLFTTSEFNFFTVDPSLCTGSSIMPQKKNLDVMEYIRAKAHTVIGYQQIVSSLSAGLPSGYNADFGETKKPFINTLEIVLQTIQVVKLTISSMKPNIETLEKSCTQELFAAHAAYELVKKGLSFREAYRKIGQNLNKLPEYNPVTVLKQTNHIGGPGNLGLKKLQKELKKEIIWWKKEEKIFLKIVEKLGGGENI